MSVVLNEVADLVFLLFDLSCGELNFSEEKVYLSFFREFFIENWLKIICECCFEITFEDLLVLFFELSCELNFSKGFHLFPMIKNHF